MNIDTLFENYPQFTGILKQQNDSVSGKSSDFQTTATDIQVFRQTNKGDLAQGLLPGFYDNLWIDDVQIPNIKLNIKDQIISGSTIYEIAGVEHFDSSDYIEPFWQLLCERKLIS
jgi:hypothetical protein